MKKKKVNKVNESYRWKIPYVNWNSSMRFYFFSIIQTIPVKLAKRVCVSPIGPIVKETTKSTQNAFGASTDGFAFHSLCLTRWRLIVRRSNGREWKAVNRFVHFDSRKKITFSWYQRIRIILEAEHRTKVSELMADFRWPHCRSTMLTSIEKLPRRKKVWNSMKINLLRVSDLLLMG